MTIEGTLKVQFEIDGEVTAEDIKELNERFNVVVEQTSAELEDIIDLLDFKLDSVNPVTVEEKLYVIEP